MPPSYLHNLLHACQGVDHLTLPHFGIRPPGGIVKYPQKEFKVAYTDAGRRAVEELVDEIQNAKRKNEEYHCGHDSHYIYTK